MITIADGLEMDPSQAATQTLGAIAAKGGGKSYLAGVVVEQLAAHDVPFVVIDPIGNWCFLKLAADGKSPGLDVPVIGGEHADVPLDPQAGAALGKYLVEHGSSAVVDVSELSKTKRKEFVADLAEALYRAARVRRTPRMVVFEEAQVFAPQHSARGEERMLGAVTDIVRLGRNYGLGSLLVTQRPQSVSKEVLNQIECLFVGGLRGPQERKAIAGWVTEQGTGGELAEQMKLLPALQPGEFFCWSPSWLKTFKRIKVNRKTTFDGSSTPTLNGAAPRVSIPTATQIDDLRALLGGEPVDPPGGDYDFDTEQLVYPDAAKAQIGDLQAEVDELRKQRSELQDELEQAVADLTVYETVADELVPAMETFGEASEALLAVIRKLRARQVLPDRAAPRGPTAAEVAKEITRNLGHMSVVDVPPVKQPSSSARNGKPSSYADDLLAAIATHGPLDRSKLSLVSGKSKSSSTFADAIRTLVAEGFITDHGGVLEVTSAGKRIAKAPPLPSGRELFDYWCSKLGDYQRRVFVTVATKGKRSSIANKRGLTRSEISELAGVSKSSSTFADALRDLRRYGLLVETGGVFRVADHAAKSMSL